MTVFNIVSCQTAPVTQTFSLEILNLSLIYIKYHML